MRFLKGDVIREDDCEEQVLANEYSWELTAELIRQGWRLLRTAREEWDRAHGLTGDRTRLAHGIFSVCCGNSMIPHDGWFYRPGPITCSVCGSRPTEPRSEDEIAALKAGKDAARAMTREEWDARHHSCGFEVELHLCDPRCRISVVRDRPTDKPELCCDACGPRPPAQPVATELAPVHPGEGRGRCLVKAGGWACYYCPASSTNNNGESLCFSLGPRCEHRWPSGIIGEGEPEFRMVEQEQGLTLHPQHVRDLLAPAAAPAPEPEHVHLRELHEQWSPSPRQEGPSVNCPHCRQMFPAEVGIGISAGTLDCPSCGWHSGRCGHCLELLVGDYRIGERDHGRVHCPRCQGVDE